MNPVQELPDRLTLLHAEKPGLRQHKVEVTEQISQLAGDQLAGIEFNDGGITIALKQDDPTLNDRLYQAIAEYQPPAPPEIPTLQPRIDALRTLVDQKGVLQHDELKRALAGLVDGLELVARQIGLVE